MTASDWRDREFEDVSSYTNSNAPLWLQRVSQTMLRGAAIGLIRQVTGPDHPLKRAVDVGCGVGDWTQAYADFCRHVIGIDVNQSFIQEARRRSTAADTDGSLEFRVADGVDPRLLDGADLICFGSVFQYMSDDRVAGTIEESGRAQQPGDVMYLRTTVVPEGESAREGDGAWYRPAEIYRQWVRSAGYDIELETLSAELIPVDGLRRIVPGLSIDGAARWSSTAADLLNLRGSDDGGLQFRNWILRRR